MYASLTRLSILARRTSLKGHVGILISGHLVGLVRPQELLDRPRDRAPIGLLLEFTPDGVQRRLLYDLTDWEHVRDISEDDTPGAIERLLWWVQTNPRYGAVNRNCQDFVSYVETGKESSMVPALALAGLAALILWGLGDE